jgi:hypothetical protein
MIRQAVWFLFPLLLCASAHSAGAQPPSASIRGTVTDSTRAIIAGAEIVIRDVETGTKRQVYTTADGRYSFDALAPGSYEMQVVSPGFRHESRGITLRIGDYPTVNVQLTIGTLADRVEVISRVPQINASNYEVRGTVDRSQIEQLPLNGRLFLELARLEPAVSVESVANPGVFANNFQRVSIAGAPFLQTAVAIDGAAVVDRINGGTAQNLSHESVQEFQIGTFNVDLANATSGMGAVNVVTRRGTNDFRGAAFLYYRDHRLAAYPALRRNPLDPDPYFARRQAGFRAGGRLITDHLFWHVDAERNSQDGAFAVANNHPIFSKLDVVHPSPLRLNLFNARLDGSVGTHRVFVRVSRDSNWTIAPFTQVTMPSNWQTSRSRAAQIQVGVTSAFTEGLSNDARMSVSGLNNDFTAVGASECTAALACIGVGQQELLVFDAPAVRIGHFGSAPKRLRQRTFILTDDLTWQYGAHRVRVGGAWEHLSLQSVHEFFRQPQLSLWGPTDVLRAPALRPLYDALPVTLRDPAAAPPSYGDLLQLPLRSFFVAIGDPSQPGPYHQDDASHPDVFRAYLQDSWTLSAKLTLTYGAAYLARSNIYNRDLTRPEYLSPLFAGDLGVPHRGRQAVDPAVGAVWRLNTATVIRSGVSVNHDRADFFIPYRERSPLGPSGNQRETVDGSVVGLTFLSTPTEFRGSDLLPLLPGIQAALAATYGSGRDLSVRGIEVLKQGARIFAPDHQAPRTLHVTAGFARELPGDMVVSADFVWRQTRHLGGFQNYPQIDRNRFNRPRVLSVNPDSGVVSFVREPIIPLCTESEAHALDPADQCSTGEINSFSSGAWARYRGLHVKLDQRLRRGLRLTASYALGSQTGFVEFTDYANFDSGSGQLATDRRHRLTVSAVYQVPEYPGGHAWLQTLTRDWTVAFISQTDSRPPLNTLLAGLDLDGDGISRTLLPGASAHNSLGRDLDPEALRTLVAAYNAEIEAVSRRVTNADGTVTIIRPRTPFNQIIAPIALPGSFTSGDSFITQDLRVTRRLFANSAVRLLLMGEVFNVFNIANLSAYGSVLNQLNYGLPSTRAGQVFGSGGTRAAQLAARVEF